MTLPCASGARSGPAPRPCCVPVTVMHSCGSGRWGAAPSHHRNAHRPRKEPWRRMAAGPPGFPCRRNRACFREISQTSKRSNAIPASGASGRQGQTRVWSNRPGRPRRGRRFPGDLRVTMSRGRSRISSRLHHRLARGHAITGRGSREGGRVRPTKLGSASPDRLGDAGHRVGGELAAAGTRAGAGDALDHGQRLVAEVAGLVLAHGLEHVLNGDVLAVQTTRQDRAAVDEDRGHIEADHRHHHTRQRLVAIRRGRPARHSNGRASSARPCR